MGQKPLKLPSFSMNIQLYQLCRYGYALPLRPWSLTSSALNLGRFLAAVSMRDWVNLNLVGGLNPSEKYESQLG